MSSHCSYSHNSSHTSEMIHSEVKMEMFLKLSVQVLSYLYFGCFALNAEFIHLELFLVIA